MILRWKNGLKVKILGGTGGAYFQERGGIFPDITIKKQHASFQQISAVFFLLRILKYIQRTKNQRKLKVFLNKSATSLFFRRTRVYSKDQPSVIGDRLSVIGYWWSEVKIYSMTYLSYAAMYGIFTLKSEVKSNQDFKSFFIINLYF